MNERNGTGLDVLLVEDDAAVAEMYRIKLRAEGHHVTIAVDGLVGLRLALERPPELLLLDIRLPGCDGLDLLARLRQDEACANVPVIVLSNYSDLEMIERGRAMGVLAHLVKSQTTPGTLVGTIDEMMSSRRVPSRNT